MNELNQVIGRSQKDSTKLITCEAAGATTLEAWERRVKATAPASGTHTITLANPKDCPGAVVDIEATNASGTVTVSGQGMDDQEITVAGYVVVWSNNESWRVLASKLS